MRKLLLPLVMLFWASLILAQSGNYVVEVAAFNKYVPRDYFTQLDGVNYYMDHNEIHRYYLGPYNTVADANKKQSEVAALYPNARVIDRKKVSDECAIKCQLSGIPEEIDIQSIRSIFFGFDKSNLRPESKRQLDLLYGILVRNPSYYADLIGHTDAKGSNEYNIALSKRRVKSARTYLLNKGIEDSRIRTNYSGETTPVAKNELEGGKDTEEGRQLNRRVEIRIFDADSKWLNQMVEKIKVPEYLDPNN